MPVVSGNVGAVFNGGIITGHTLIAANGSLGSFNGGALVVQNSDSSDSDAFGVYDSLGTEVFTVTTGAADLNDYSLVSAPFQVSLPTPYVTGGFNVASFAAGASQILIDSLGALDATNGGGVRLNPIHSGALTSVSPASTTAFQCATTRDTFLVVPVTYNPTAGAAATCKIELSPDNNTYTTLSTDAEPAGVALDNTVRSLFLQVPAAWWVKLTVTNAVLGTGHYY